MFFASLITVKHKYGDWKISFTGFMFAVVVQKTVFFFTIFFLHVRKVLPNSEFRIIIRFFEEDQILICYVNLKYTIEITKY